MICLWELGSTPLDDLTITELSGQCGVHYTKEFAMEQVHWDDAVVIEIADGVTQTVRTVADAENILLARWNRFELDSLGIAIKACLLCTHDNASTEDARLAFQRAASTSGLLV